MTQALQTTMDANTDADITLQEDGSFISNAEFLRDGSDLHMTSPGGKTVVLKDYFSQTDAPDIISTDGARLSPEMVDAFLPPQHIGAYANTAQTATDASPAGQITELTGNAFIIRADGTRVPAEIGTPVYPGDVIETSADSAVNLMFSDNTTFAISDSARLSIDEFIYDASSQSGSSFFSMLQGMFVYTSGLIGKDDPGNVNIETPVGSIGIRGTVVAGNIAPAGEDSTITVIDGAIVVSNSAGVVEMGDHFQTVSLAGHDSAPQDIGVISFDSFSEGYQSLSTVTGSTFSDMKSFTSNDNTNDRDTTNDDATESDSNAEPDNSIIDGEQHLELDTDILNTPDAGVNFGSLQSTTFEEEPVVIEVAGNAEATDPTGTTTDPVNNDTPEIAPPEVVSLSLSNWYMGMSDSGADGFGASAFGRAGRFRIAEVSLDNLTEGVSFSISGDIGHTVQVFNTGTTANDFDVSATFDSNVFTIDSDGVVWITDTTALLPTVNAGDFDLTIQVTGDTTGEIYLNQEITLEYLDVGFTESGAVIWMGDTDTSDTETDPSLTAVTNDTIIAGIDADDIVLGRGGDDIISGRGGKDTLIGGAGDDQISVGNHDLLYLDGGAGTDVLILGDGNHTTFEFSSQTLSNNSHTMKGIEILELSTDSSGSIGFDLDLRIEDVFDMTVDSENGHQLQIRASSLDNTTGSELSLASSDWNIATGTIGTGLGDVTLTGTHNGETVTLIIEQNRTGTGTNFLDVQLV